MRWLVTEAVVCGDGDGDSGGDVAGISIGVVRDNSRRGWGRRLRKANEANNADYWYG